MAALREKLSVDSEVWPDTKQLLKALIPDWGLRLRLRQGLRGWMSGQIYA